MSPGWREVYRRVEELHDEYFVGRWRSGLQREAGRQQDALMAGPLSNRDAKLRVHMRAEISSLQDDLGVTTIYVTHDQVEAMTMGDRVAVMRDGLLQQVDTPQEIYAHPVNTFVAGFVGSPPMNIVSGELRDGRVRALSGRLELALDGAIRQRLGGRASSRQRGAARRPLRDRRAGGRRADRRGLPGARRAVVPRRAGPTACATRGARASTAAWSRFRTPTDGAV